MKPEQLSRLVDLVLTASSLLLGIAIARLRHPAKRSRRKRRKTYRVPPLPPRNES